MPQWQLQYLCLRLQDSEDNNRAIKVAVKTILCFDCGFLGYTYYCYERLEMS